MDETKAWAEDGRREAEFEKRLGDKTELREEWGSEWKAMATELDRKARKELRLSQVSRASSALRLIRQALASVHPSDRPDPQMRIPPALQEKANVVNRKQARWARQKGEKRGREKEGA